MPLLFAEQERGRKNQTTTRAGIQIRKCETIKPTIVYHLTANVWAGVFKRSERSPGHEEQKR